MSNSHTCIIYGLTGTGSRMTVTVPDYIEPIAMRPTPSLDSTNAITVETNIVTRKSKSASRNIKPTNGNRLALR